MLKPFENIKVMDAQKYTHDTWRYFLRYEERDYDFVAGQFITFDLPISEHKRERYRSYSIASAPSDSGIMELIIKRYEDGEGGSVHITDTWEVGSIVRGRPPQGKFLLQQSSAETSHVFLCTGVGVAPFRSMIYDVVSRDLPYRDMHLVYGCRMIEDILYQSEFEEVSELEANIYYHIAVSREKYAGHEPRRIDVFYDELVQKKDPHRHYYICGWRNMVDATRDYLEAQGIDKSLIHFELYG